MRLNELCNAAVTGTTLNQQAECRIATGGMTDKDKRAGDAGRKAGTASRLREAPVARQIYTLSGGAEAEAEPEARHHWHHPNS